MRSLCVPIVLIILLASCKQTNETEIDYCGKTLSELNSQTFIGTIFLCNAQPPEMAFLAW